MIDQEQESQVSKRPPVTFELPSWWDRPGLCWDFYPTPDKFEGDVDLSRYNINEQETLLVEDIMRLAKNISISVQYGSLHKRSFHIDRTFNASLRELAERIIPLCESYSILIRFIEGSLQMDICIIKQSLGSCLMENIQTYFLFVAQLENSIQKGSSKLGLSQILTTSSAMMSNMECLAEIAYSASGNLKWYEILNILHKIYLNTIGDESNHNLVLSVCNQTVRPFILALKRLLECGQVSGKDHFDFYRVMQGSETFQYFNEISDDHENPAPLPDFIPAPCHSLIWRTGYYLNLVRQSKSTLDLNECQKFPDISYENYSTCLESAIRQCYQNASKLIYNLLVKKYKLIDRLRSMRCYFFLTHGDFLVQFLDTSWNELKKSEEQISLTRIQGLFDVAVRMSSCANDKYNDDVRVQFFSNDIFTELELLSASIERKLNSSVSTDQINNNISPPKTQSSKSITKLKGFNILTLEYDVSWPVSLIINDLSLKSIRLIFHHLFFLKFIERYLGLTIGSIKYMYTYYSNKRSHSKFKAAKEIYALAHRMLKFVQALLYHASATVLEPKWHSFLSEFDTVITTNNDYGGQLSKLVECLNKMLAQSFEECLLSNLNITRLLYFCLEVCRVFAEGIFSITSKLSEIQPGLTPKMERKHSSGHSTPTTVKSVTLDSAFSSGIQATSDPSSHTMTQSSTPISFKQYSSEDKMSTSSGSSSVGTDTFLKWLSQCESSYSCNVCKFIKALAEEEQCSGSVCQADIIGSLLLLLDFNDFYKRKIALKPK
ncbi:hypothetical protein GJ496_004086 [Pomphorhynchus laevis]|nr:hypothetical protein GJ496_004086 [Pomphorhynchus laevis]